jgi:hypothetical protein
VRRPATSFRPYGDSRATSIATTTPKKSPIALRSLNNAAPLTSCACTAVLMTSVHLLHSYRSYQSNTSTPRPPTWSSLRYNQSGAHTTTSTAQLPVLWVGVSPGDDLRISTNECLALPTNRLSSPINPTSLTPPRTDCPELVTVIVPVPRSLYGDSRRARTSAQILPTTLISTNVIAPYSHCSCVPRKVAAGDDFVLYEREPVNTPRPTAPPNDQPN